MMGTTQGEKGCFCLIVDTGSSPETVLAMIPVGAPAHVTLQALRRQVYDENPGAPKKVGSLSP